MSSARRRAGRPNVWSVSAQENKTGFRTFSMCPSLMKAGWTTAPAMALLVTHASITNGAPKQYPSNGYRNSVCFQGYRRFKHLLTDGEIIRFSGFTCVRIRVLLNGRNNSRRLTVSRLNGLPPDWLQLPRAFMVLLKPWSSIKIWVIIVNVDRIPLEIINANDNES